MNGQSHQKLLLVSDALRQHPHQNHAVIKDSLSVNDARNQINLEVSQPKELYYIYVVDAHHKLRGTISAHELLATKETEITPLIRPTDKVLYEGDTLTEAKQKLADFRLYDLPVISRDGTFQGSLSSYDLTGRKPNFQNTIENELIFKLLGIDIQSLRESTFLKTCMKRSLSLAANVIGGTICAIILFLAGGSFQGILALTLFMPVLLTITEAIAGQAVAMSIENISKRTHDATDLVGNVHNSPSSKLKSIYQTMTRESLMGASIGLVAGLVSLAFAALISRCLTTGLDIRFTIIFLGTVVLGGVFAALIGFATPKILDRFFRTWVAAAANPVSLAVSDIATLIIYIIFIVSIARVPEPPKQAENVKTPLATPLIIEQAVPTASDGRYGRDYQIAGGIYESLLTQQGSCINSQFDS